MNKIITFFIAFCFAGLIQAQPINQDLFKPIEYTISDGARIIGFAGGNLLVGTSDGYYTRSSTVVKDSIRGAKLHGVNCIVSNYPYYLYASTAAVVSLGTDKGFFVYDKLHDSLIYYHNITNSGLVNDTINAICIFNTYWKSRPDTGYYFVGTRAGLSFKRPGIWKSFTTANSPIPSNNVTSINVVRDKVYIGTDNGFAVFMPSDSSWEAFDSSRLGRKVHVTDISVNELENYGYIDNSVYLTTLGQGIYIMKEDSIYKTVTKADGLCSDTVYFMHNCELQNIGFCRVVGMQGCGILISPRADYELASANYYKTGFNSAYKFAAIPEDYMHQTAMLTDSGMFESLYLVGLAKVDGRSAGFGIAPNPARHLFEIKVVDGTPADEYVLMDVSGRSVAHGSVMNGTSMVDINGSASGIYFVKILHKGSIVGIKRLVVE